MVMGNKASDTCELDVCEELLEGDGVVICFLFQGHELHAQVCVGHAFFIERCGPKNATMDVIFKLVLHPAVPSKKLDHYLDAQWSEEDLRKIIQEK